MSKTDNFVFKGLVIVAWIIFVGLCIESGALIVNFIYSMFKPEIISKLYQKLADQSNVSLGLVIRHIKKLESLGMIQVLDVGEIRLVGNNLKEIRRNAEKIMYVEAGIDTYQDIKKLLYAIPLLSNLRSQSRTIEKKKHLQDIKHAVDNRQSVSKRDYKSLTRFLKKHDGKNLDVKLSLIENDDIQKFIKIKEKINYDVRINGLKINYKNNFFSQLKEKIFQKEFENIYPIFIDKIKNKKS